MPSLPFWTSFPGLCPTWWMSVKPEEAHIATPPRLSAGTPQVVISEDRVVYGDLRGSGQDVAAIDIWCANTGGTADGQVQNSWVIFAAAEPTSPVIGVLTPQQPTSAKLPHVPYFDDGGIAIEPGRISVQELWYGPDDGTCCPTGRATTVWTLENGTLHPRTTIQTRPAGS